ncbi:NAD(P)-binding protein, partial [Aureobasidium melanogenum]|uniref:NAD(P)-binding protein n=1 Tax=Aureobasidium melanogenum (strain CBS 110374) TaxID=1043003 RepID=A0A074W3K8_AURM1
MSFNPTSDIPDLSGKVIIVTGGSSGLGKESVHQLVKHNPAKVYLAARTSQRGNAAIEEIVKDVPTAKGKIHYLEIDMASFASVKRASNLILAENDRLDILMNNAGLANASSGLTTDGYEIQFGTNYMGPTLFTKLLLPLLQETAKQPNSDVRIINLSSEIFKQAPKQGIIFADLKTPMQKTGSIAKYGQSKLGNYLFTKVCAQKYPAIKSVALHPGVVNTGIWDNMFKRPYVGRAMSVFLTPFLTNVHDGAKRQLWASTANSTEVRSGAFYTPKGSEYTQAILKNDKLANELWDWTQKEFAKHGF